jgi:8-amino-7-oxononanoate synthase
MKRMLWVFWFNRRRIRSNVELQDHVFARIMTFGKGLGCHGAAILGSIELREYLINFARSLYHWAFASFCCHDFGCVLQLRKTENNIEVLRENIIFQSGKNLLGLNRFVRSKSAIQSAIIPEMKSKSDSNPIAGKWI